MIPGLHPSIEGILNAANQAPSGENCQPWHFIVRGFQIEVHLLPERDLSAYGWGQRASYLANGAAIENLVIFASKEGFAATVKYFPNLGNPYHVATIVLTKDETVRRDPLAEFIYARVSNRKPFNKKPLDSSVRDLLLTETQKLETGKLKWVEDPKNIRRLGRVGSTNEEIMLVNKELHNFFFSHVSWTKTQDEKNRIGFYIKTLELPPPAEKMFKLISNWRVMGFLQFLGLNKLVAKQNGNINSTASAIGAFLIENTDPINFVKIGRAIERTWLLVTSLGLSFQPLTGILFFKLRIDAAEDAVFSKKEKELITSAYGTASEIIGADGKHIAFMFRIGTSEPASAHAIRFPLADVVTLLT